jgi:hypothetical protein
MIVTQASCLTRRADIFVRKCRLEACTTYQAGCLSHISGKSALRFAYLGKLEL